MCDWNSEIFDRNDSVVCELYVTHQQDKTCEEIINNSPVVSSFLHLLVCFPRDLSHLYPEIFCSVETGYSGHFGWVDPSQQWRHIYRPLFTNSQSHSLSQPNQENHHPIMLFRQRKIKCEIIGHRGNVKMKHLSKWCWPIMGGLGFVKPSVLLQRFHIDWCDDEWQVHDQRCQDAVRLTMTLNNPAARCKMCHSEET